MITYKIQICCSVLKSQIQGGQTDQGDQTDLESRLEQSLDWSRV